MIKRMTLLMVFSAVLLSGGAQERTVQNRPYTDLRSFHFGVLVGTHLQDLELVNRGSQMIDIGDGNGTTEKIVSADQDRWDAGFTVGVLGELRLSQTFQFRVAPSMYFGAHHITFRNLSERKPGGEPTEVMQELKTVYISCGLELIAAAPRFNNHRPYFLLGINPMVNLSGKDDDYVRLKRTDVFLELGLGCDFYLPYFKLRPELKFMFGLTDCLNLKRKSDSLDKRMPMYVNSVSEARAKMIALTFYFE